MAIIRQSSEDVFGVVVFPFSFSFPFFFLSNNSFSNVSINKNVKSHTKEKIKPSN